MEIINSIQNFRFWREKIEGSIGFIPTMGALHDGHVSLINISKNTCKNTVVSIYVNRLQFSPSEDLATYPNNLKCDLEILSKLKIQAVFLPTDLIMYPKNFSTFVQEKKLSKVLEGKSRPLFFKGVTTVVAKLFNIIQPTHTFFGEKDAQQLRIIKKMINDLAYNIKLISCPIIRENNGLAMSSRNKYLSKKNQKFAYVIYKGLKSGKKLLDNGERNALEIKQNICEHLKKEKNLKIDYVSIADLVTLCEITGKINNDILVSMAAYVEGIRLIDNFNYLINSSN